MGEGLPGGTTFMEDYTYHLAPGGAQVLGAHMLEICPSIAAAKPSLEIHPLGIGGKEDPGPPGVRCGAGPALNASLIDLGNRFRLVVDEIEVGRPAQAAEAAGGARGVGVQARLQDRLRRLDSGRRGAPRGIQLQRDDRDLEDFAAMAGIELTPYRRGDAQILTHSSRICAATRSTSTWRVASAPEGRSKRAKGRGMHKELKREAYEANVALPRHGLINLTFGNASAIDRAKGVFAIKPSGVDYAALKPEDMVDRRSRG